MSVSAATITVNPFPKGFDHTQREEIVNGTITVSLGTYPAGGYSLTWSTIEGIHALPNSSGSIFPINVDFQSVGNPPSGYLYFWNATTGNMHVFCASNATSGNSGPLVEGFGEGTSTTPGKVLSDTIAFTAYFPRA